MNFKALFTPTLISVLALSLSACGHFQGAKSTQGAADQPVVSQSEPNSASSTPSNTEVDGSIEPTLEPDIISDSEPSDIAISLPEVDTVPAEKTVLSAKIVENDVINRIRRGFKFPELMNNDVRQHIQWAANHTTYLKNLFDRAEPFLYFIVEEIEKRDLPMELALLPAVESAYNPSAVSRSKAAGLWQFVPSTGRGFGLRQDWWYDGRHDPYSSTYAALDYLEQLHKMFDGDWFIALAAYNAGPGTLRRVIRKAKRNGQKTNYTSLNLRSETRRYIPKLVALKLIVQNPEQYGVTLPKIANRPFFKTIDLPGQIDLVAFSEQSNIDPKLLKHLNRGFKRWATPPTGPNRLLVPLDKNLSVDYAIVAATSAKRVNFRNHLIKKGDTLNRIAYRYGVSVAALKSTNKLSSNRIRAGKTLLIPTQGQPARALAESATNNSSQKLTHRVSAGDTLWSIARRYQVKLDQLLSWNNLNASDVLSLNQRLTVFLK